MAFTYELALEDGTPADRPKFVSAVPTWKAGDTVLIRPGFEFEIVRVVEGESRTTWVVRRR